MIRRRIIREGGLNEDTKLYRYTTLSQFLSLIENKQIYVSKVNSWDDTWEVPISKIPTLDDDGTIKKPLYQIEDDMFGQCWSTNFESDAMWRIYSPYNEGILIETSVQKFDLLKEIQYGMLAPVIYYEDLKTVLDSMSGFHHFKIFGSGYLKRKAFSHEDEVRLIVLNDVKSIGKRELNTNYIAISVEPLEFIEGITIDPRASSWYVNTIQEYCRRVGFNIVPKKSSLYGDVFETTRLYKKYITVK